ncbi:MAG: replication restart DNA helicase PriA [Oscillatoriales cyanobacterium C42_A2020_001]|nr:replication restart DNA helicase PriA [Leptolyngbyaceae cyanobacterium C42_A2020_001]
MNLSTKISIYCPNCGGSAERHTLVKEQLTRTQCAHCDYLMITCSKTGNVIEAYAPGYSVSLRAL